MRDSTFGRVRVRAFALAALLLLAAAVVPLAASAHFLGNAWGFGGSYLLPLKLQNYGGYPDYASAINQGASNWWNTATPVDLDQNLPGNGQVIAYSISSLGGDWGVTHIYTDPFGWELGYQMCGDPCGAFGWGNYRYATVALARDTLDMWPQSVRVKVATHELGHAQGLGHPLVPWCGASVMQQGWLPFNTPQAHDAYDFNRLYPSAWWPANPAC